MSHEVVGGNWETGSFRRSRNQRSHRTSFIEHSVASPGLCSGGCMARLGTGIVRVRFFIYLAQAGFNLAPGKHISMPAGTHTVNLLDLLDESVERSLGRG